MDECRAQIGGDRGRGGLELIAGVAAGFDPMSAEREVARVAVLQGDEPRWYRQLSVSTARRWSAK
jgi:hypothetical protein